MSNAYICDGCKKNSPDKDGLYIANQWAKVTVCIGGNRFPKEYHLCTDCFPTGGYGAYAGGLANKIINFFKSRGHP